MMLLMPGFATAAAKFCYGRSYILLRPRKNLVAAVAKPCYGRGKNLAKAIKNMPQRGNLFNEDWVKLVG
ncbi:hypothetical protein D0T60_10860 [Bacteroides sp. 224]|nr:hypothetical protein [Bacteroides sp. 224]